jgi:uncharacterized membrane-anchored protein
MGYTVDGQGQTSHVGAQRGDANAPFSPITWVLTAVMILRLSAIAILILIGALAYAVVNTAVRGLIMLIALGTLVFGWLLYQVIRMTTACATANGRRPS